MADAKQIKQAMSHKPHTADIPQDEIKAMMYRVAGMPHRIPEKVNSN
jgi:hypothetical protein